MKKIQAIRGMNDILPDTSECWAALEALLRKIVIQYDYREIRSPMVEYTELFARTIGEATDIVEKEMYTFIDRNGDSLTLRPEGTAGCIRAGIEHGLFYNKIQRLFYCGPMFRYERPQKGRYRQFHQFGVEAYGLAGPDIDVEMMLLAMRFWQELKINQDVILQINTLGNADVRAKYRHRLVEYFNQNLGSLDEDSRRRLLSNPFRILDSKNPEMRDLIKNAPKLLDYLDLDSGDHFEKLCKMLDQIKLPYVINPCLVRGLDYYDLTVFEWVAARDQWAQNTLCAGGHYDTLVAEMGGKPTPAIGFAMGLERLLSMVLGKISLPLTDVIYFILLGDQAVANGMLLAENMRKDVGVGVIVNCGGGDLSAQLKRADKSGARFALILGEQELTHGEIIIKYLRENQRQEKIKVENLESYLLKLFK